MSKRRPTKLNEMVEIILRNKPETRNSDIALMIEIWAYYFPHLVRTSQATGHRGIWLDDLYSLPREDNIKRARAILNAEGKYYPTDWKVAKARGLKEDEWRAALGYPTKAQTVHPTKTESYMDEQRDFTKPKLFS